MSTVSVNTFSYSVTYVTNQLLSSLRRIIVWIGLDPGKFLDDWPSTELAVGTWLHSHDLESVVLEVFDPRSNALVGRWDFTIDYTYGNGDDGEMWADTDAIRYAIAKCGVTPASCQYQVLLRTKPGRPDVPGWSPTHYRSTDGFVKQGVGTAIGTHAVGAQVDYWRKK